MAHRRVNRAVLEGLLLRPRHCSKCGAEAKPDAHHENYDEPLAVQWLCRSCHMLRHREIGGKRLIAVAAKYLSDEASKNVA
jgi:hypothetical protein